MTALLRPLDLTQPGRPNGVAQQRGVGGSRLSHGGWRIAALAALVLASALLSGCLSLPTSGPVVEVGGDAFADEPASLSYLPAPPARGATPSSIVDGFLDAMTAIPSQMTSARAYLTVDAQSTWEPGKETWVYTDDDEPVLRTRRLAEVTLTGNYRLDERGVFTGVNDQRVLRFELAQEGGEWRIDKAPDALIVGRQWAADNLRTVQLYYLDPTGEILVPEPVTVPSGAQFVDALMTSLVSGPGPALGQVARNYLRADQGADVIVDPEGIADVTLDDGPDLTARDAELASIQLAWTLRQEESVRGIRLTADGEALTGLSRDIQLGEGAEYDPAAFSATTDVFALRDGLLVGGDLDDLTPVEGPFGEDAYGLNDVALSLDSTRVAGVDQSRTSVLVTETHEAGASVGPVVSDATRLLKPAWDFADRLWLVDRADSGARVSVVVGDRQRTLAIRGISGKRVTHFLVSRDGSRFLAVVRGSRAKGVGDRLMASRIRYDERGALLSATKAQQLPWPIPLETPRFLDMVWQTPTTFSVIYPAQGNVVQVRTLSVDGAPNVQTIPSATLTGDYRWLVGSPEPGTPLLAATPNSFTDISRADRSESETDITLSTLTYTG
jgi:hypothetical protein